VRILLIGGSGQLGSDLQDAAGRHAVVAPSHAELDVTDRGAVERLVPGYGPDAVIDAAAFHKVELCEADPIRAFAVNAVGALDVATAAQAAGARCVFVSTDYVFDGAKADGYAEDDPARPLNVYGISKAAGEHAVRAACPDSLVVRGSGLFGHAGSSGKGGNFVETMLAKAAAGERISVVDDQTFAPSSTRDMAERVLLLLEREVPPGTYHVANAGSCSWFEFARATFELAGVRADLSPRPSGEQQVRRPAHSVLLDARSTALGLPPNRHWRDALAWYLRERDRRRAGIVDTPPGRRYHEPA
jgi:dTDP-4-dehydrorhamnose reductase